MKKYHIRGVISTMQKFLWGLSCLLLFTNAMKIVSQRTPVALKKFKQLVYGLEPKLEGFQPELLTEEEAVSESIEIFRPVFSYLTSLYPDPIDEAEILITAYIESFKTMPPKELIEPVMEDALRRGERVFYFKLNIFLQRSQDLLLKTDANENIGLMREILDAFEMNINARKEEVQAIFPDHDDVDQALLSSIKGALLSRTVLEKGIKNVRSDLSRLFSYDERQDIFESISKLCGHYYGYNYLIRMMEEARKNKGNNAEILIRIYALASSLLMVESFDYKLPFEIYRKFNRIAFKSEKEKSFVRWRLANYNLKKRMEFSPPEYQFTAEYLPVHELILYQIMFNLEKFIDLDAIADLTGKEDDFFPDWVDFRNKNFHATVMESTPSAIVLKIFNNRMDKVVPDAIRSNAKYRMFENLSQDDIIRILAPTVEQVEQTKNEQSFFDFKVETDVKKKKKKRKQTRVQMETSKEDHEQASSSADINLKESLPSGETRIFVDTPESKDLAHEMVEDMKDKEEEMDQKEEMNGEEESKQVDEEVLIKEEVEELMRLQNMEIQIFKKLKKQSLDLARARRSKVNVVVERQATQKKPRMVAFLHTDDLRLINDQANELYLRNTVQDAGRNNVTMGNGKFRWIFNPEIVIDFDGYQFLCQVFNVVDGQACLTYDLFLKTFSKLNPIKANVIEKRSKALNRTVFQFDHAFECEHAIYVPPIGGAHREHLSSRFNHQQIRKFLMHGGCHPYFFERL
jgi:hypothetical protein